MLPSRFPTVKSNVPAVEQQWHATVENILTEILQEVAAIRTEVTALKKVR